jgi:hypothetical protein
MKYLSRFFWEKWEKIGSSSREDDPTNGGSIWREYKIKGLPEKIQEVYFNTFEMLNRTR